MKKVVFRKVDGKYNVPKFVKYNLKNRKYYFEYNGKLYDEEIDTEDKELKQISFLTKALNIKNKKERLSYAYDKACDLLDDDFYGKNVCKFNKSGKCVKDRKCNTFGGGCCCDHTNKTMCKHLLKDGCKERCLACKFYTCSILKNKGYKYDINDIYVLKYIFNIRQKIMLCNDFFMTKDEVLKDVNRNSILLWSFRKTPKFVKYEMKNK